MGSFFHGLSWIFPRLLDHSVEICLLICLIFLVKFLAPRKLPPWWHYSLWLLLLVRMLVPMQFENRLSLFSFVPSVETPHVSELISAPPAEMEMVIPPTVPKSQTVEAHLRFVVTKSIPVIWLTGAMILGVCILFESISFWRIVRRRPKVTDEAILALLSECKSRMKIKRKIDILVTDNVRSPALFGYIKPRLLLPEGIFEKLSDRELAFAFMHELGHLKRHDIGVSWLIAALQVIHWFNPLVWLAFYQIRIDQESACDAAVLSRMKPRQSADYAKAIVDFLEKFCHNCQLPALAGVLENRSQMKKRIARIVQYRKSSQKLSAVAVSLFAASGFVLFTLTGVAAEKDSIVFSGPVVEKPKADSEPLIAENSPVSTWNALDGFRDSAASVPPEITTEGVAGLEGAYEDSPMPLSALSETALPNEAFPENRIVLNAEEENGPKDTERAGRSISLARLTAPATGAELEPVVRGDSVSAGKSMAEPAAKPAVTEIPEVAAESMQKDAPDAVAQMTPLHTQPLDEEVQTTTSTMNSAGWLIAASDIELDSTPVPKEGYGPAPSITVGQNNKNDIPQGQMYIEAESVDLEQFTVAAEIEMLKETGKALLQDKTAKASMTASAEREKNVGPEALRAADIDTPPQVIKGYKPRYPYIAKRDDISGSIMLQFVVTKEGNAVDTKVVESEPKGVFDESALKAIEQYRFKPGIKDGKAVDVKVNLPIKFDLS